MASQNQSPSYLLERERARRWLLRTAEGRMARDLLIKHAPRRNAAPILDDDSYVQWDDLVQENRGLPVLAASSYEARKAFELARQAKSTLGVPVGKDQWMRLFTAPIGYVLRRQVETADPYYWNDPVNLYREALDHPEWCPVPSDYIRGKLEGVLPKNTQKPRGLVLPWKNRL